MQFHDNLSEQLTRTLQCLFYGIWTFILWHIIFLDDCHWQLSGQAAGCHHAYYPKHPGHNEHAGVAEKAVEYRDLGDGDDGRHVGQALGEQQPEVGFVVDRTEGITHGSRNNGVDAGEDGVQGGHHHTIADLGPESLVTCDEDNYVSS